MRASRPQAGSGRARGGPAPPRRRRLTPPAGPAPRGGAARPCPSEPRPERTVRNLRRQEAANSPSESTRQAEGSQPAGAGGCGPAGTAPGLGRCRAASPNFIGERGEPVPARGSVALHWNFAFPLRLGQASVACLLLGAERPAVRAASRPGSEGVTRASFWLVPIAGRVPRASPRVAGCAWK